MVHWRCAVRHHACKDVALTTTQWCAPIASVRAFLSVFFHPMCAKVWVKICMQQINILWMLEVVGMCIALGTWRRGKFEHAMHNNR